MSIELLLLAVGVAFWLASLNLDSKYAKIARTFQTIAIWLFLVAIAVKGYHFFLK